ncbi:hypothetical protein CC1G_15049 [Coprinopsis cinerea okayama7|uniref:Uncharacterized protein n=1 Tax=Coprinopsis cinerea (strain Okayama-7 / 130 / ATCC MYA-4618 / FGSC 9003) TaxID=240176 RepID=D6RP34_COPC7|nr:hypothetical protein CC1G_15049 [Coprinopsis cinerea okayama7\|eukprot:XP_002910715.1 hypothetical protein CC1G_15049 [Coprinopsis cinerea okayama7\
MSRILYGTVKYRVYKISDDVFTSSHDFLTNQQHHPSNLNTVQFNSIPSLLTFTSRLHAPFNNPVGLERALG